MEKETTGETRKSFQEFIEDTKPLSNEESWIAAFADYFLKYFDTFSQMASETGISEAELNAMFSFKLKFIDKVKYQEVMEKNVQNKIIQVADYIISTGASTRKAALEFGVSNATISDWMNNKLPLIDDNRYKEYLNVKNKNTAKSVNDEGVANRVNSAVDFILAGFTIEEIANRLSTPDNKITPMMIYRDLKKRLLKLNPDPDKIKAISEELERHSRENLWIPLKSKKTL